MTKFCNDRLDFLLIEVEELRKLVLAIKEMGDTAPTLYGLAYEKAERICHSLLKFESEEKTPFLATQAEKPLQTEDEEIKSEENEECAPAEPQLYTQPILIETPTAPLDTNEAVILNDKIASITTSLSDALQKRTASTDLRKAFSLNDRFRFQRELFGNNAEKMEEELSNINKLGSLKEAIDYISQNMRLSLEDEVVVDFVKILERRFS